MRTEECESLLALLLQAIDANKGQPAGDDDRHLDAEALGTKCCLHAATALHLASGPVLPVAGGNPIDVPSISVVVRAAAEAMLVFRWLFVHPEEPQLYEFRYSCWKLKDLQERQRFPNPSEELKTVLDREVDEIDRLSALLEKNRHFKALKPRVGRYLLKGRGRHQDSWARIGEDAGLSELSSSVVYAHLCSHAHSGAMSVSQLRSNPTRVDQERLVQFALGHLAVVLAYMVRSYCLCYTRSADMLAADPHGGHLVDLWCGVGSGGLPE